MRSITDLVSSDLKTTVKTSGTTTKPAIFSREEQEKVARFFFRLGNIYGSAQVKREWPTDEAMKMAKREYAAEIIKFSDIEIHKGFERIKAAKSQGNFNARELDFLSVSVVLRYIREFRLDNLDLPGDEQAFQQAVGNARERHPAVIFTLRNMGTQSFNLRRSDEKTARDMFTKGWAKTVQLVVDGGEIPEPEKQIPERPEGTEAGRKEAAKTALSELRGMF